MNNTKRLAISSFLVIGVWGTGWLFPNPVSADHTTAHTISQLQEQVAELQARIKELQNSLGSTNAVESQPVSPHITPEPTSVTPVPPTIIVECPVFKNNLYRGANDDRTGGEVSNLQKILSEDPEVYPEKLVTGYYGALTEKAVQRWQAKHNIVSSGNAADTGYGVVGPQTRAKITRVCAKMPPTPPVETPPAPPRIESLLRVLSPNGGEQWALGSNQTIRWLSTSYTTMTESVLGQISYVNIRLLNVSNPYPCQKGEPCSLPAPSFSTVLAYKIPNTGSFTWTVGVSHSGSIIPAGFYIIEVEDSEKQNQYDRSDAAFSIVAENSGNLPPTISGVSGPTTLQVGEAGKWEVKATDPEQGPLAYSVGWGDENIESGIAERAMAAAPNAPAQTATFTHVYSKAGTYAPVFTVTDNGGLSAKTSISVTVGSVTSTNRPPVITSTPTVPSDIKVGETLSFSWGASDPDGDDLAWTITWGDGPGVAGACQSPHLQNNAGQTFRMSHAWTAAGTYTVKVIVGDCRGGSDEHAFNVAIGSAVQPFITVVSPNGGETWVKGTTQAIKWQDNAPVPTCPVGAFCMMPGPKYYDIKLVPYYPPCTGNVCPLYAVMPYTIAKNVAGYLYNWSVGKIMSANNTGDTAPDGSYTIQICEVNSTTCDSSDSYFKIESSQPVIKVLAPNGGEQYGVGSVMAIQVRTTDPTQDFVTLRLVPGETEIMPTVSKLPGGIFSWTIPTVETRNDYRVEARLYRMDAAGDPHPQLLTLDKSDGTFSISNYDACRLDQLDGSNITRDAIEDQTQCLIKICDIYGPANLTNGVASKCLFKWQEIKRYSNTASNY